MSYPDNPEQRRQWVSIVSQIQAGQPGGQQALYEQFHRGLRIYFAHELRHDDVEDRLHDTIVAVVYAIQNGQVHEPERLAGFVRTVAQRRVTDTIRAAARQRAGLADFDPEMPVVDPEPGPDEEILRRQRGRLAVRLIESLREVDRQILIRYYLRQQSSDQICEQLGLTKNQFRLRKSRAQQKLAGQWQRMVEKKRPARELFLRAKAAAGD